MSSYYSHSSLKESEKTLHYILDTISDGVWDWNACTGRVERSPSWYRMLNYDIHSMKKDIFTWENLIHPDDYERVMKHFESYLNKTILQYHIKYRCKKADGSYLWIQDTAKIVEEKKDGTVLRMIGSHVNINKEEIFYKQIQEQNKSLIINQSSLENIIKERTKELEKLNKKLEKKIEKSEYNAFHDVLTGIYNRRKFEELLNNEMNRAKRYSHPLSLILLDIDNFKNINDKLGHRRGYKDLKHLASLLQKNIRNMDLIARWGGDEFILVLPNTEKKQAKEKADKLKILIENTLKIKNTPITCSFGVSQFESEDSKLTLFERTDKALFLSKKNNRNTVTLL